MAGNPKKALLTSSLAMIEAADQQVLARAERFRHSFELAIDKLRPDTNQPRRHFDAVELQRLATSLLEQGQLQPVLVRKDPDRPGHWILAAGERRWRAARLNGWDSLLAIELDGDPDVAALVENLQRVDLSPVEEAMGIQRLIETHGWTQAATARALGKSTADLSSVLRIAKLSPDLLARIGTAPLPKNILVEIARLEDPALQTRLVAQALQGRLTVQAIRNLRTGAGALLAPPAAAVAQARPLGLAALEKMVARLGAAVPPRAQREAHRAQLLQLRREIERLIAALDGGE